MERTRIDLFLSTALPKEGTFSLSLQHFRGHPTSQMMVVETKTVSCISICLGEHSIVFCICLGGITLSTDGMTGSAI